VATERSGVPINKLDVSVYRIPTDYPEADGTAQWDSTTMVLVEASAADGSVGLGYTYASAGAGTVVKEMLENQVRGRSVDDTGGAWDAMVRRVRNAGRPGVCATAISAVDIALWDLKARVYGLPLARLLGQHRTEVPIYGSGGFTTYSVAELQKQLGGWVEQGIPRVKMKIGIESGRNSADDVRRAATVRKAIGPDPELFIDANGAYTVKQAIDVAKQMCEFKVTYFEEPVSSDHLEQLAFVRQHAPMSIAAGEYAYDPWYVREMLEAGAVDIQQADVTRCLGITGWLEAAAIAHGYAIPFSGHCAPSVSVAPACAAPQNFAHLEYFHDHVRIENMFFDGVAQPEGGVLRPDLDRPGLGLEFKRSDAERYRR
jgi:L-alanine-DL-glutamate epimerase-like enolase superfamily enzyme